jgi:hypothetical protein
MTILTVDSGTSFQLNNLVDLAEIRDESGRVWGYFHPLSSAPGSANVHRSPFTIDELRERQQQRSGKPLSEVLAKLKGS